jgi:hypothetical protein
MTMRDAVMTMAVIGVLAGGDASAAQPPAEALPRWMAGCWSGAVRGTVVTERWVVADAATMIGTSHTLKDQAVSEFEFLRVVVTGGVATYVAQPGGAPPTAFAATTRGAGAITFENPRHDFPKRVGYRRVDATHLTAWIDGGAGASGRPIEFPLTRVSCEP